MRLLDATNAEAYLRETGRLRDAETATIRELSGGVSNVVLYVSRPDSPGGDFVLKQAREQLRTPQAWFCTVERIWREVEVLRICQGLLEDMHGSHEAPASQELTAVTPSVLFEDRDNYCFGMTAAPPEHRVWKRDLLDGRADPRIAGACGRLLGALHAGSWLDMDIAQRLGDRKLFDELRIDPYYRTCAIVHPDLAPAIERLIDSVWDHALCLTHADFSPKNLLVYEGGLMMVDYETGHFGDPAFDLGFFLSHLILKAFQHAPRHLPYLELTNVFWSEYTTTLRRRVSPLDLQRLVARAIQNLAGCALARLDGKSRIDYLQAEDRRDRVRRLCRRLFQVQPTEWAETMALIGHEIAAISDPAA